MKTLNTRPPLAALLTLGLAAVGVLQAPSAHAQTGVSDDRVSLPDGPGSLEGIGESASVNANMGQLSHQVVVQVPPGYGGLTPDVTLNYSSGLGSGVVGVGWNITYPQIERLTLRGLPEYDTEDEFAVNGSEQLVKIPNTDPPVYRARMEGGFVRYTWRNAATGKDGYWMAEYPDGRIGYFGADQNGTLVTNARVGGTEGTFRYHLTEMVDRYGHSIKYTYIKYGNVAYPLHIGWVYSGGSPRFEATFAYEDRTDKLSDCKAGFEELMSKRLSVINVRSDGALLRKYTLAYEDESTSGGFSRLSKVTMTGAAGGEYPIVHGFEYSKALGVDCAEGADCTRPYIKTITGQLGVDLSQGNTTLIDINGDALPDVLDTTQIGNHRFFINAMDAAGNQTLTVASSAIGTGSDYDISKQSSQVLDIDGNGFTDLLNAATGKALLNRGQGDWESVPASLWGSGDGGLPTDFAPQDGELKTVRFLDYDGDKKIDIIKSSGSDAANVTQIYKSSGIGNFEFDAEVESIGAGFDSGALELNDMNGDGLLDPVEIQTTQVRYRLNYGRGQWGPWVTIGGFEFTDAERKDAELEDVNGDSLADIVLVSGDIVEYWVNRNGASFDPVRVIDDGDVEGDMPTKDSTTTVLFADMNGNGSSDVVWISAGGQVTYLEIFPVRPNLLSSITNGIGKVTDITYGTSVMERARDGGASGWDYELPQAMTVVTSLDEWDLLTNVHNEITYSYHHGWFDGVEKAFRGYREVEIRMPADDSQEAGHYANTYDLGIDDPYRAGLQLVQETWGESSMETRSKSTYEDCDVAGIPDGAELLFDVRHVCKTRTEVEHREGQSDSDEWVVTAETMAYDGYGQVTRKSNLGVISEGGGACAACTSADYTGTPCGASCLGDEHYTDNVYAKPDDNGDTWILGKLVQQRGYGVLAADGSGPANANYTETTTYYDGEAYVGLGLGKLTKGTPTRKTVKLDTAGTLMTPFRARIDAHGNIVELIGALGSEGVTTDHRRRYTLDADGLRVLSTELLVSNAEGPYVVRRDYVWDATFDEQLAGASRWYIDGAPTAAGEYAFGYDEFGRRTFVARPGTSAALPSESYTYDLGSPYSRIVTEGRTEVGGDIDIRRVTCMDGHGRTYQARTQVSEGSWLVSGFATFNKQGSMREGYDPYMATSDACETAPPEGTSYTQNIMDGTGRIVATLDPAPEPGGVRAETRSVFRPLAHEEWDREDTRLGSAHAGTPTTTRSNGDGKIIAIERRLTPNGAPEVHRFVYDELGRVRQVIDPSGITQTYTWDLAERLLSVDDPDRGLVTYELDDAGNRVRETDGAGRVTVRSFDSLNRMVAEWEEGAETTTLKEWFFDMAPDGCPASQCSNPAANLAATRYTFEDGTVGEDRFGWDLQGRLVWSARNVTGVWLETSMALDHLGRTKTETSPSGVSITRHYDGAGRVTSIPGYVESVLYDEKGFIATMTLVNGVTTQKVHDDLGRVTSILAEGVSGDPLLAYTISWDYVGNLLEVQDDRKDVGLPMGGVRNTFDALYHASKMVLDPDRPDFEETLTPVFDASERMTALTSDLGLASEAHVGALTYGQNGAGPRAVSQAGTVKYTYDDAGRLTARGTTTYTWDHKGRMTSAKNGLGQEVTFGYDTSTTRVWVRDGDDDRVYGFGGFEVRDGTAVTSVSLNGQRVAVVEQPAFAATYYSDLAPTTGADQSLVSSPDALISAGDAWIAQAVEKGTLGLAAAVPIPSAVPDLLDASNRRLLGGLAEKVTFEHQDVLGSTVVSTDAAGAVTSQVEYYPFGLVRHQVGAESTRGFTGQEREATASLIHFPARYLDPWIGRWTQPDPGFPAVTTAMKDRVAEATSQYAYCSGNPASLVDATGKTGNQPGSDKDSPEETDFFNQLVQGDLVNNNAALQNMGIQSYTPGGDTFQPDEELSIIREDSMDLQRQDSFSMSSNINVEANEPEMNEIVITIAKNDSKQNLSKPKGALVRKSSNPLLAPVKKAPASNVTVTVIANDNTQPLTNRELNWATKGSGTGIKAWFHRKQAKLMNGRVYRTIKEMQKVHKTVPEQSQVTGNSERGKAMQNLTGQKTVNLGTVSSNK